MELKKYFPKQNNEGESERKSKRTAKMIIWVLGFLLICGGILYYFASQVVEIDPLFHYHKPDTDKYYYELYDERYQNDGILRTFDYDAIIIGSSMAQNFKISEVNETFGVSAVKTTFPETSFREMGDRLKTALASNDKVKLVIASLDMDYYFYDEEEMADKKSAYPEYLYDDKIINDFKYVLNREIIFDKTYRVYKTSQILEQGITSFDNYSVWSASNWNNYGIGSVLSEDLENYPPPGYGLGDYDKLNISRNVNDNILSVAEAYPDVEFYYFIPPYSALWWNEETYYGMLAMQIQAEQYILEQMLPYDNIHIYSFNTNFDLTMDFNNYMDDVSYGDWVNTAMLLWIKEGTGLLTEENYLEYIRTEYNYYTNWDYTKLNGQYDDEDDRAYAEWILYDWFTEDEEEE